MVRQRVDPGSEPPESVTRLLVDAQAGDALAWDRIYALLYAELHRIAHAQIRQRTHGRISATSLVSESWLRLNGAHFDVKDRRHFTALVARAMRFVLMDEVRRNMAEKRGEGRGTVLLDGDAEPAVDAAMAEMIALDAALDRLARFDLRLAQLVEMRYFGGLDETEIAEALGVTDRTLRRDWRRARAFLIAQLGDPAMVPA